MFATHLISFLVILRLFFSSQAYGDALVLLQANQEVHTILTRQSKDDEEKKRLADEYFEATLFKQAIPFYRTIWESHQDKLFAAFQNDKEGVLKRLILCYYMEEKFSEIIKALEGYSTGDFFLSYMLSHAYRHLKHYEKAKDVLLQVLRGDADENAILTEHAKFDLGIIYFLEGEYGLAEPVFLALSKSNHLQIKEAACLNLIRIALQKKDYVQAEIFLSDFDCSAEGDKALKLEALYLRGKLSFSLKNYAQAAAYFESSLPTKNRHVASWYQDALYHLGWCYLKMGNQYAHDLIACRHYLEKSEIFFQQLTETCQDEQVYLALGLCCLMKASILKEAHAYQSVEDIFSKKELFTSEDGQRRALRLRAGMAPSFWLREKYYKELTEESHRGSPSFAKDWYLRACNSLEQASFLLKEGNGNEANRLFQQAASEFAQAFEHLKESDKKEAAEALKRHLQACYFQNQKEARLRAIDTIDTLLQDQRDILEAVDEPDEFFYLKASIAMQIAMLDEDISYKEVAIQALEKQLKEFPEGAYEDKAHYLLAWIYREEQHIQRAKNEFLLLVQRCENSPLAGSALFFAAVCADQLGEDESVGKKYRLQVLERYPTSSHAAEAAFTFYTYREYMQGDKLAIKHLQGFCEHYPASPFILNAYFLIGLDCKRDRKAEGGKWIRKKNLKDAIDVFHQVETRFQHFQEQKIFSDEQFRHYLLLYYKAKLERAFANLRIAESSQGAKQMIYREYAANVFKELIQEMEEKFHLSLLAAGDPFPLLQQECYLGLAQVYIKGGQDVLADQQLTRMIEKYRAAKITRGYFLSRVWYEKGGLAQKHAQMKEALTFFKLAEDAGKGKVLTSEQKLALWIEQSLCYRQLNQLNEAMLLLSKVINSDVASGLRLKAMFLRSEMYELQGRQELAKKQLETIVKKGGDWSSKAKEKLEKTYGLD